MNVDYQILTNILATRIKESLHTIIHPDQNGFVADRYIGKTVEIIYISDKLESENNVSSLVSFDFYKAIDTLEWPFIKRSLNTLIFQKLIKWMAIIYNKIDSQIINNGHMSESFIVTRVV